MAKLSQEEEAARAHLARWVRSFRRRYETRFPDDGEFARHLGISAGHLSNILSGKRTPGLDVALRISAVFGIETDRLLKEDPRELAGEPPGDTARDPVPASSSPARPRRRREGGGRR